MYADVTTIYCVGESVAKVTGVTVMMNRVLGELTNWWKHNSPLPHSKKCEGMILHRINFNGPLDQIETRRAENIFGGDRPPPPNKSQGLNPALRYLTCTGPRWQL